MKNHWCFTSRYPHITRAIRLLTSLSKPPIIRKLLLDVKHIALIICPIDSFAIPFCSAQNTRQKSRVFSSEKLKVQRKTHALMCMANVCCRNNFFVGITQSILRQGEFRLVECCRSVLIYVAVCKLWC